MRRRLLPLALALATTACTPSATTPGASGAAGAMTRVGDEDQATMSGLAVDGQGRLHAVYRQKVGERHEVRTRMSADGGATWGAAETLWTPRVPDETAGMVQAIADAQGTVHAVYAHAKGQSGLLDNVIGAANWPSTIEQRARGADGAWGPPATIGEPAGSFSWFAAPGAGGAVEVAWLEDAVPDGVQVNPRPGVLKRATLAAGGPGAAREVFRTAVEPVPYGQEYRHYEGLRGHVDAAGELHLAAYRTPAADKVNGRALVWRKGEQEVELARTAMLASGGIGDVAPFVFADAQGQDHVLALRQAGDRAAVVDFAVGPGGSAAAPAPIRPVATATGVIEGFTAVALGNGRAAVFSMARDTANGPADLWLSRYDGGWQPAVNLTGNAGRDGGSGGPLPVLAGNKPIWAAGAADPAGNLHVLLTMSEKSTFAAGEYDAGGDRGGAPAFMAGSTALTPLYYLRAQ